tara:strand:- start:1938 stop:2150 length:213 start_codon:yes stop_codon:yes gene_type:complete
MLANKKFKDFNNLDKYPDLKQAVVPTAKSLPIGSLNTKVIIIKGVVVKRIFKTPQGELISLFHNMAEEAA